MEQEPARPQQSKGEAKRAEGQPIIKVNSDVVTVAVTMTDDGDRPVQVLAESAVVFDDKAKRGIA